MLKKVKLTLPLAVALAAALSAAAPAEAQGRGNGNGKKDDRPRVERRDDRRDDDDRWDDRRDRDRDDRYEWSLDGRRRVPRGWCQGRGNPHNTVANCGYRRGHTYYDARYRDRDRDRDRYDGRVYDRRGSLGGYSGTYEQRHDAFHRDLKRWCDARTVEAGANLLAIRRVRSECNDRHQEWHRATGTRH